MKEFAAFAVCSTRNLMLPAFITLHKFWSSGVPVPATDVMGETPHGVPAASQAADDIPCVCGVIDVLQLYTLLTRGGDGSAPPRSASTACEQQQCASAKASQQHSQLPACILGGKRGKHTVEAACVQQACLTPPDTPQCTAECWTMPAAARLMHGRWVRALAPAHALDSLHTLLILRSSLLLCAGPSFAKGSVGSALTWNQ